MAKRVSKTTETSAKQTAATRRTKKTKTATKKAPAKKTTTKAKTEPVKKTVKVPVKKAPVKKAPVKKSPTKKTATKKPSVKKGPVKKTVKTTLAAVARVKAENEAKVAAKIAKRQGKGKAQKREYYVLPESGASEKFREMGEKVRLGEVKWAYYAISDDIGYHHYEKLK